MKVTVFGATGRTGRLVVRQALDGGHDVTAVVRDPGRLPIGDPSLDVVTADLTDPDSLRPVLQGRNAVISAIGPNSRKEAGITAPATKAIAAALRLSGVSRLVVVSASPVGPVPDGEGWLWRSVVTPMLGLIYRAVYADLDAMEAALRDSNLDWTVLRPPRLTNGAATGRYRTCVGGNVLKGHSISRADLATAMIAVIDDPATVRQPVGVAS